jgi:hypothetical protein
LHANLVFLLCKKSKGEGEFRSIHPLHLASCDWARQMKKEGGCVISGFQSKIDVMFLTLALMRNQFVHQQQAAKRETKQEIKIYTLF